MGMRMNVSKMLRILCASGACTFHAVAFADTTWNAAVDGNWSEATNWDNGVPGASDNVILPPYSKDYTVTFDSVTDNVIGGLKMSTGDNLTTVTTTVLRVEKPLTIRPSSRINIYRCGQIVIPEGGKLTIEPTSAITQDKPAMFLNYRGALLHLDGGTFEMRNQGYFYVCNGWSIAIGEQPPEVRITAGDFRIVHKNASDTGMLYYCYGYNKLNMTGGRMELIGRSADQAGYKQLSDIESLKLSGSASFILTNCSFVIGRGSAVFGGSSRFRCSSGRFYVGGSDMDDKKAKLTLADDSSIDLYNTTFSQFGSGGSSIGSTVTVNFEGGNHTNALWNVWGCGKGTTAVNVTGGIAHINRFGLVVAAPWFYATNPGHSTTGTVSVSGGVLSVTAEQNKWGEALGKLTGFIIGCGAVNASTGYHFDGRLNVSGDGIVTNGAPFAVGVGLAEGSVTQTGGEIYSYATFAEAANAGNAVAIGMCGAKGTYSISDGKSTFFAPVWVGGMSTNHLHRKSFNIPPGSNGSRASTGTLAVSGGSFCTKNNMYVGCDGTGTIDLSGGTLQVDGNLVLSNAVKSVVKVALRADRTAPIAVGGKLIVTDAAELEVDVSALGSDEYGKFPLISAASLTGEFDPSKVSVTDGALGGKLVWRTTASGTELCYHRQRGTMLILY